MPHPEREHELMIEVARLRREVERQKARADAAVAEIVNEQRRFGEMQREAWKLESALAAARLQITETEELYATSEVARAVAHNAELTNELLAERRKVESLRAALQVYLDTLSGGFLLDAGHPVLLRRIEQLHAHARAALAAPGDGEEGTR